MFTIRSQKAIEGFTVVELIVSIGILAVLFALTIINLGRLPSTSSQQSSADVLIGDLRAQQTLAMSNNSKYGVHFESGSYSLFKGSVYSPTDPSNFAIVMDPGLSFTNVTFPGSDVVFAANSGEVVSGEGGLTLSNTQTGENKTINLNKYGSTF